MKYNIDDKVVDINDLEYIDNPYHYETALKSIKTVKSVSDNLFSTYKLDDRSFECIAGASQYKFFYQENGMCMLYSPEPYRKKLLHIIKDRKEILTILKTIYDKQKEENDNMEQQYIDTELRTIERAKVRIKQIKENGVSMNGISKRNLLEENYKKLLDLLKP